ncbi:hypothetical protein Patl1_32365 [Pistacia atlantica]|uniref:Uncharacterized protein n=1 Tax=Pistacia atlantica TaxID=434234 RepID=A0ACC1ALL7_9ROSI|nr:hypothetical protein Patl1_32365 [Pistacia atlantica]
MLVLVFLLSPSEGNEWDSVSVQFCQCPCMIKLIDRQSWLIKSGSGFPATQDRLIFSAAYHNICIQVGVVVCRACLQDCNATLWKYSEASGPNFKKMSYGLYDLAV